MGEQTKVDLITGFLGAGKTTFIRKYAAFWRKRGEQIRVIENEFGSVAVDKQLLRDEDLFIDDLSGCCMCCTGRDRFRQMLIGAAHSGIDRVLVEPSGIYDVDEFFSVMRDGGVKEHCRIGAVLMILDAKGDRALSGEARSLMRTQLYAAGTVIMSKVQLYPDKKPEEMIDEWERILEEEDKDPSSPDKDRFEGVRDAFREDRICIKDWDAFEEQDFIRMADSGFHVRSHRRELFDHEETYQTCMLADLCEGKEDLENRIQKLFSDGKCGQILRVKGYIRSLDSVWYEVNCTREERQIEVTDVSRGLLVVIGQKLDEDAIRSMFVPRTKR